MENTKNDTQKELTFIDLWHIITNHIYFILIITILSLSLSIVYVFFVVTPNYISNADVMVQVEQDSQSSNNQNFDLVNAFRIIDTVAELMEKEIVLKNAIERLEAKGYQNLDVRYLREGLLVRTSSTSYFINVSFIDEDSTFAKEAVDSIINAVIEETDIEDAFPVLEDKIRRTSFASNADYNSPNKTLFIFVGLLLGLAVSIGFVLSKELLSTHYKSKDEIESSLEIQVIGAIPIKEFKEKTNGKK